MHFYFALKLQTYHTNTLIVLRERKHPDRNVNFKGLFFCRQKKGTVVENGFVVIERELTMKTNTHLMNAADSF